MFLPSLFQIGIAAGAWTAWITWPWADPSSPGPTRSASTSTWSTSTAPSLTSLPTRTEDSASTSGRLPAKRFKKKIDQDERQKNTIEIRLQRIKCWYPEKILWVSAIPTFSFFIGLINGTSHHIKYISERPIVIWIALTYSNYTTPPDGSTVLFFSKIFLFKCICMLYKTILGL